MSSATISLHTIYMKSVCFQTLIEVVLKICYCNINITRRIFQNSVLYSRM